MHDKVFMLLYAAKFQIQNSSILHGESNNVGIKNFQSAENVVALYLPALFKDLNNISGHIIKLTSTCNLKF